MTVTFNVYKWKNPDLQVLWMFLEIQVRIELQYVPKFLATDTGATSMLPTVRLSILSIIEHDPVNLIFTWLFLLWKY